jgi:hypothetical protein
MHSGSHKIVKHVRKPARARAHEDSDVDMARTQSTKTEWEPLP